MERTFFVNNDFLPESQALLSVKDIGLLRGFAIFDFFRTVNHRPLMMVPYLRRFIRSAQLMELPLDYTEEQLAVFITRLINENSHLREAGIRLILTGGYSENAFLPTAPNFAILVEPVKLPPKEWYQNGIRLITHAYQREFSEIKTTNYLTAVKMAAACQKVGAVDVMYHHQGELREVSRSNVFVVKDGVISTPAAHILMGITRQKVIELAKPHYLVEERPVLMKEVFEADELFMTGTTKRVLPVVQVDERRINTKMPGPVTRHLLQLFTQFEQEHTGS